MRGDEGVNALQLRRNGAGQNPSGKVVAEMTFGEQCKVESDSFRRFEQAQPVVELGI